MQRFCPLLYHLGHSHWQLHSQNSQDTERQIDRMVVGLTNQPVNIFILSLRHQTTPIFTKMYIDLSLFLPQEIEQGILWTSSIFFVSTCFALCLVCQAEEKPLQQIFFQCTRKLKARDDLREKLQSDCTIKLILTNPTYYWLAERHCAVGITWC